MRRPHKPHAMAMTYTPAGRYERTRRQRYFRGFLLWRCSTRATVPIPCSSNFYLERYVESWQCPSQCWLHTPPPCCRHQAERQAAHSKFSLSGMCPTMRPGLSPTTSPHTPGQATDSRILLVKHPTPQGHNLARHLLTLPRNASHPNPRTY